MLPVSQQRCTAGEPTLARLFEGLNETPFACLEGEPQTSARRRLQATLALIALLIWEVGTCYLREAAALQTRVRRPSVCWIKLPG